MQMEKVNSKAQIAGTTYEYLDRIGEPIPMKKMVWKRFWNIIFGLIGIHQSRSSCLIYVTKFVQVISCNLPLFKTIWIIFSPNSAY